MDNRFAWCRLTLPSRPPRPSRASVEADVRARMVELDHERIRRQIDAERDWLGMDVTTADFLAEYLPAVAA